MQARLTLAVLLGVVLLAAGACSGGGDDERIAELETGLAASEEALERETEQRQEAEDDAAAAKKKAEDDAAAAKKKAEDDAAAAKKKADDAAAAAEKRADDAEAAEKEAEQEAQQTRQEAQRRIEEAETQADANVRASALISVLTTIAPTEGPGMGVAHTPGERLTFSRPNALPAKGSAPSVPGSWRSASYSGPRGSVGTDTVYLYTNIQPPGSKAFWKVHGEKVETITEADATVSGFGTQAKELYPASDDTPDGSTTTSGEDKARSIGGTYDGYSGTFKCESECDIAAGNEGALKFIGTWTFTASLTAKRSSKQAEQDSEFLYFGIWAFEPTDPADQLNPHSFNWAAGGDEADIPDGNFSALTGEAKFTGGAIGKYALAKATGRGARAARTGTFTATAKFTAVFDGDDSTISGRITDFKEGGSSLGSDWNVFLGGSPSTPADLTAGGVTTGGVASGVIDGDNAAGVWTAMLHGSDNYDEFTDRTKYPASKYPVADVAGVAGWFNAAAGTNAAIAGAFGAACTTGTMCAK